jgi:hypothetical protein
VCPSKHVEKLRNIGIINSTTRSHLVDYFYKIYIMMHESVNVRFAFRFAAFISTMKRQLSVCILLQTNVHTMSMHLFLNLEVSKLRKQTQVLPSATVLHGLLLNLIAIFGLSSGHVLTLSLPTAYSFPRCPSILCSTLFPFSRIRDWLFLEGMSIDSSKYNHYTLGIRPAS